MKEIVDISLKITNFQFLFYFLSETILLETTTNTTDVKMTTTAQSSTNLMTNTIQYETNIIQSTSSTTTDEQQSDTTPSNLCVLCLEEEKRIACIPCGHLTTCAPCSHSLRSCPICRREIEAFVRIYT